MITATYKTCLQCQRHDLHERSDGLCLSCEIEDTREDIKTVRRDRRFGDCLSIEYVAYADEYLMSLYALRQSEETARKNNPIRA
jgi:hypothetical protein